MRYGILLLGFLWGGGARLKAKTSAQRMGQNVCNQDRETFVRSATKLLVLVDYTYQ